MMIRTSKHNISNNLNTIKSIKLDGLFNAYKLCLNEYINLIFSGGLPLKTNLSSKDLPTVNIIHSRYKQLIYKHASEIVRSNYKKSNEKRYNSYKKIYNYFVNKHPNHKFTKTKFSELKLKDIIKSKYFIKPNISNLSISLDERFFDIKEGKHFDSFVKIILPFFNEKGTRGLTVNTPLKQHKHSNTLMSKGYKLRKNIQLKSVKGKYFINLVWEKQAPVTKTKGCNLGFDIGYKKLIASSGNRIYGVDMEKLYTKISNKKQGSKNFKQLLTHRDNEINRIINEIDLTDVKCLVLEDLKNVKHKSKLSRKFNNKLQRWSYIKVIKKLELVCMEKGIRLVKVSPAYTSQTCNSCGNISKESRELEEYKCISCGYEIDADINASKNIHDRGVYSLSDEQK